MSDDDFLTVREVAEQFRVKERTVRTWVANGRLKAVKAPGGKNLLIRRSDAVAARDGGEEDRQAAAPVTVQVGAPFKATDSRVVRPSPPAASR